MVFRVKSGKRVNKGLKQGFFLKVRFKAEERVRRIKNKRFFGSQGSGQRRQ